MEDLKIHCKLFLSRCGLAGVDAFQSVVVCCAKETRAYRQMIAAGGMIQLLAGGLDPMTPPGR
jgi:hypothetical protein